MTQNEEKYNKLLNLADEIDERLKITQNKIQILQQDIFLIKEIMKNDTKNQTNKLRKIQYQTNRIIEKTNKANGKRFKLIHIFLYYFNNNIKTLP